MYVPLGFFFPRGCNLLRWPLWVTLAPFSLIDTPQLFITRKKKKKKKRVINKYTYLDYRLPGKSSPDGKTLACLFTHGYLFMFYDYFSQEYCKCLFTNCNDVIAWRIRPRRMNENEQDNSRSLLRDFFLPAPSIKTGIWKKRVCDIFPKNESLAEWSLNTKTHIVCKWDCMK